MRVPLKTKALPNLQLKQRRDACGLSQARLAELVGCGQGDIAKLETGAKRTTAEWSMRLAPFLNCSPRELFPAAAPQGESSTPPPIPAQLDPEKLRLSMSVARRMAAAHAVADPEAAIAGLAAAIYDVLAEYGAVGSPAVVDDQAAAELIELVVRRFWRPPP